METTKIDKSIFAILSTISINNLTSEQSIFILHASYVKENLKFQIITSQYPKFLFIIFLDKLSHLIIRV